MRKFLRANVYPEQSGMADELAMMRQPSKLPECEGGDRGGYTFWFMPIGYVVVLVIFMFRLHVSASNGLLKLDRTVCCIFWSCYCQPWEVTRFVGGHNSWSRDAGCL